MEACHYQPAVAFSFLAARKAKEGNRIVIIYQKSPKSGHCASAVAKLTSI
jgi:hypothetical protein